MINTFLNQLGGISYVAKALTELTGEPVKDNAVYQWPHRETIPHKWRFYLAKLAKKQRVKTVPEELKPFM